MRSTRGCATFRVIFSRKNSEKGMSIFHKNFGKDYNVWKKFQIKSIMFDDTNNKPKEDRID